MPAEAVLRNPHYCWSPIAHRPRLTWPDGARVAVAVLVTLERMEWYPPTGGLIPPTMRRFHHGVYPGVPDLHNTSQYEYGNRVGVFRVLDELCRAGLRATVAADARLLDETGFVVDYALERGAEFIGHGVAGNRLVSEAMPAEDEEAAVEASIESVRRATGRPPRGWHNPEYSASSRTLDVLVQRGIDYVVDWPTDEQPHELWVGDRRLINLPTMVELDDVLAHVDHAFTGPQLADAAIQQFERLSADGATNGRLFLLNVHPWLTGQPFRIRHLRRLLDVIAAAQGVWRATGVEIADWFRTNPPGASGSDDTANAATDASPS